MRTIGQTARYLAGCLLLGQLGVGYAAELPARPTLEHDLLPLFKARCVKCHGPVKSKGKLNLSTPRAVARGGEGGAIVEGKELEESALWERIASGEMPPRPDEPLSDDEKAVIRRWIEQGANGLPRAASLKDASPGADHWAFAHNVRPEVPSPRDATRILSPVDRFIQAALEERGLSLSPEADRATLIRRLSFDLIGLPPTPQEIEAFAADSRPDAVGRLVERLLASPHYGERWGKFWLDAAGYTESNGYFSADSERPLAWRYRDFVLRAFNTDRPLDQIVREQLAGDELSGYKPGVEVTPELVDMLAATHFLRNGQDGTGESDGNPDEVRADKVAVLDGAVQIIGSSLLGLTIQCARCHDHKFEPVTQKDYYQFHAILYPAFNVDKWVKPNDRVVAVAPREALAPWEAQEKQVDAEVAELKRRMAPRDSDPPKEKEAKKKVLDKAVEVANAKRLPHPGRIPWVTDVAPPPPGAPLLLRGNPTALGPVVSPAVPAFLADPDNPYDPRPPMPGTPASGRRLALARWLTRPGSRPASLLARVLANRIWQQHFGSGLVSTSDNLGYTGSAPTHPALLEYLASELIRTGWSAKALHRLILVSAVYQQTGGLGAEAKAADPDNRLLSAYPVRRLDAEALRDAMLASSAELDLRQGGPSVPSRRTESGEVVVDEAGGGLRRSVYLHQRRTQLVSLLEVFDAPSIVTTCSRRLPATVPLQSLSMLNSEFVVRRAARLAERVARERPATDDPAARVARTFLLTVGRNPELLEREAALRFLQIPPSRYPSLSEADARRQVWADFCQMVLASNAFLYVD